ncbi:hypothetical protein LINGRAHAP2_LOCUS20602 [Linum grandiflorum]
MKNSSATTKIVFSLLLLSIVCCMVMTRVVEARGPIVNLKCGTVLDCGGPKGWCSLCQVCACRNHTCTCIAESDVADALINPPTTSNNNA